MSEMEEVGGHICKVCEVWGRTCLGPAGSGRRASLEVEPQWVPSPHILPVLLREE